MLGCLLLVCGVGGRGASTSAGAGRETISVRTNNDTVCRESRVHEARRSKVTSTVESVSQSPEAERTERVDVVTIRSALGTGRYS